MSLLANVVGFGAFGFATRCFQLGLQKRFMFDAPHTHVATAAAFGLLGWGVYELEGRQKTLLDARRTVLISNREKEREAFEKNKAEQPEQGGH